MIPYQTYIVRKCCFCQIYCRSLIQSGWLTLTISSSAQKGTKVNWKFTWCHFIEKNIPNLFSVSGQWWPTHQIIKNSMACQSLCLFKPSMQRCIKPQHTNSHTINPLSYGKNSLAGTTSMKLWTGAAVWGRPRRGLEVTPGSGRSPCTK